MSNRKLLITIFSTITATVIVSLSLFLYISHEAEKREIEKFQAKLEIASAEIEETVTEAVEEEYVAPTKPEEFKFNYDLAININPGEYATVNGTGEIVQISNVTTDYVSAEEAQLEEGYEVMSVLMYVGSDPEHDPATLTEQVFDYQSFNLVDMEGNKYDRYEDKELWYIELEPGEITQAYLHWIVPTGTATAYMEYIAINDTLLKETGTTGEDHYSFFVDKNTTYPQ